MLYKRSVLKNVSEFTDKHKKQSSEGVLSKEKMFLKILQNSQKNIFSGVSFLIKLQAGNLKPSEEVTGDVHRNRKFHSKYHWKQPVFESLINKVAFLVPVTLSKKTSTQVLSCEIYNYFEEHLGMSTCKLYLKRDSKIDVFL